MNSSQPHKLQKILLLPPYIWLSILLLLPFLLIFAISLSEYAATVPPFKLFIHKDPNNHWVINFSLENFKLLLEDKFYIR